MTPSKKSKRSRWEVVPMKRLGKSEIPEVRFSGLCGDTRDYGEFKDVGLFLGPCDTDIRFRVVKDSQSLYVLIAERKVKT